MLPIMSRIVILYFGQRGVTLTMSYYWNQLFNAQVMMIDMHSQNMSAFW